MKELKRDERIYQIMSMNSEETAEYILSDKIIAKKFLEEHLSEVMKNAYKLCGENKTKVLSEFKDENGMYEITRPTLDAWLDSNKKICLRKENVELIMRKPIMKEAAAMFFEKNSFNSSMYTNHSISIKKMKVDYIKEFLVDNPRILDLIYISCRVTGYSEENKKGNISIDKFKSDISLAEELLDKEEYEQYD
ncbi:hypothetical protein ACQQ97_03600 [Anaerovoracaceae bacterium SGI.195]